MLLESCCYFLYFCIIFFLLFFISHLIIMIVTIYLFFFCFFFFGYQCIPTALLLYHDFKATNCVLCCANIIRLRCCRYYRHHCGCCRFCCVNGLFAQKNMNCFCFAAIFIFLHYFSMIETMSTSRSCHYFVFIIFSQLNYCLLCEIRVVSETLFFLFPSLTGWIWWRYVRRRRCCCCWAFSLALNAKSLYMWACGIVHRFPCTHHIAVSLNVLSDAVWILIVCTASWV